MSLKHVISLVTGSASGLGRATAARIVAQGGRVILCDLPTSDGANVAKEMGERAHFCPTDVTNADDVTKALDVAQEKWGPLNVAVNCAGIGIAQQIYHPKKGAHPLDLFRKVIDVNLVGTFNVMRLSAERMAAREMDSENQRGVIVNTASIAAMDGQMGQVAYSASKGAIVGMTLPVARDLAKFGIRVNTIAPGLFLTPLLESLPEKARVSLAASVPNPSRLGRPDEYAFMVQHVIENVMLNAEVIRIDGGLRMV